MTAGKAPFSFKIESDGRHSQLHLYQDGLPIYPIGLFKHTHDGKGLHSVYYNGYTVYNQYRHGVMTATWFEKNA